MNVFGKGVTRLCVLTVATLFAASSAWAVNCSDERKGPAAPAGANFGKPMQFIDGGIVSGYGRVIYAVGAVMAATATQENGKTTFHYKAFDDFLAKNNVKPGTVVVFHSPGGVVNGGLAIGEAIRSHSLRTSVGQPQIPDASTPLRALGSAAPAKGECDSSCSLAFLGGVRRTVPTGSFYGVHAIEQGAVSSPVQPPGEDYYSGEVVAAEIGRYAEKMGADPIWLNMAAACAAGFEFIQYLTPAQLEKSKTVTPFSTSWDLSDNNGAIVVEGKNPDFSAIPNNHDDLVFGCAGTPRRVAIRVDYLPEAYNAGQHGGGVRAPPADFIKSVSGFSLSGSKAGSGANSKPTVVNVDNSDIVAPLSATDAHHVSVTIALTPAVANLLKQSDRVQVAFNKQTAPVGTVDFDLSEGQKFITDYSAACQ